MLGVNKVILVGHVGRIESRSAGQSLVTNFSVATSHKYKDKSDNWIEQTEWHNCVSFGKLSEIIGQYVVKGSKIFIEGNLKTDKYEKDGVTMYTTKIIVREIRLLDSKQDSENKAQSNKNNIDDRKPYDFEEEIPF